MALGINTNLASLSAQRALNNTQSDTASAMQRLSTGLRINSAKDDAAGMAVASRFTSQISGMQQASRNASDAVSMLQTAEGGLQSITDNLQRIRELSVQAASDSISATDRGFLNTEVSQLVSEINRVADTTKFNGNTLLNGDYATASSALTFQVGADNSTNDQMNVTIGDFNTAVVGISTTGTGTVSTTAVTGFDAGLTVSLNGLTATAITATDTTSTFDGSASYAAAVATELNALEGVTATSSATTSVNMGTMTLSLGDAGDTARLIINGESITFGDLTSGLTASDVQSKITTAVGSDTSGKLTNITATVNASSELVITDSTGKQLSAQFDITNDNYTPPVDNTFNAGGFSNASNTEANSFNAGTLTAFTNSGTGGGAPSLAVSYSFTPGGTASVSTSTVTLDATDMLKTGDDFATALQTKLQAETGMSGVTVNHTTGNFTISAGQTAVDNTFTGGSFGDMSSPVNVAYAAGTLTPVTGSAGTGTNPTLTVNYDFEDSLGNTSSGSVILNATDMVKTGDAFATALEGALQGVTGMTGVTVNHNTGTGDFTINGAGGDKIAITGMSVNDGDANVDNTISIGNMAVSDGDLGAVGSQFTGTAAAGIAAKTDLGTISVALDANTSLAFTNNANSGLADSSGTTATGAALSSVSVATQAGARTAIDAVDNALKTVSEGRANLGAFQSRFESVIANLDLSAENAQAARSRVQDADFAVESANLAKNQVLQQAGMSVLAQANALPQQVLALLQ